MEWNRRNLQFNTFKRVFYKFIILLARQNIRGLKLQRRLVFILESKSWFAKAGLLIKYQYLEKAKLWWENTFEKDLLFMLGNL